MADDPKFIPTSNTPDHRQVGHDSDGKRMLFGQHWTVDDGLPRMMHPADRMTFGSMRAEGSTEYVPVIKIHHALGPVSLVFVPTVEELRVLGETLIATANEMKAAAGDMLAAALAKKGKA